MNALPCVACLLGAKAVHLFSLLSRFVNGFALALRHELLMVDSPSGKSLHLAVETRSRRSVSLSVQCPVSSVNRTAMVLGYTCRPLQLQLLLVVIAAIYGRLY